MMLRIDKLATEPVAESIARGPGGESVGTDNVTAPSSSLPSRERRVLIVEDNDTTRARLAEILRSGGYHVDEAIDGLAALKKVSAARYDAIVLDLVLPHVDGWRFRETALLHPELAWIPTVIITVRPLREQDRYALRTQFVIRKPFDASTVLALVERACRQPISKAAWTTPAGSVGTRLFWSRRGEVACLLHAPPANTRRWSEERWSPILEGAFKGRIAYQCQYCADRHTPIRHGTRAKITSDR
jgi:CheY-like chemotaxis protein